jgi:hypothetical protein
MNQRLPLIISATALLVALLGSTPLGRATESALEQVVPRAKKADFAANAGKLNGHRSSVNPKRGQIPVVGADGKLSESIGAIGPVGPKGDPGPAGATGYQQIQTQISIGGQGFRAEQVECPSGKSVLGAGHLIREQDADHLSFTESRPISNSTWRFKFENETGESAGAQSMFIVCATMSQ